MNQHDDVLAKMDELLKKHHDALARNTVMEDFPVLTEVVGEADDVIPVLTEVIDVEPDVTACDELPPDELPLPGAEVFPLDGKALSQLERQIKETLEYQLPFHVIEAVDKAMPIVLEALSTQLENMVRQAVAQELKRHLTELQRQNKL